MGEDIVSFVAEYRRVHGYSPTQNEVAQHLGISRPTARKRLARLIESGQLEVTPGAKRTIRQANAKGKSVEL